MSSGGPRCSDIATLNNQTPTQGRRVLLLRLAEMTYLTVEWKGIRTKKASGGGHAPGPAGQATPDPSCHPGGASRQPRPHFPALREEETTSYGSVLVLLLFEASFQHYRNQTFKSDTTLFNRILC